MSKPDEVFVNTLAVNGFLNGVVNLTFTTARWGARENHDPITKHEQPFIVAANDYESLFLRMDLDCAQKVHEALGAIIEKQTQKGTMK
jgi:hypothetical protein